MVNMDIVLLLKAFIMGMVEGLTEFLPISSTGHLIITAQLLDFMGDERRHLFEISIQLGAILAVCWEYRARLLGVIANFRMRSSRLFFLNIILAFLPAAILGFFFIDIIKEYMFHPVPVAVAFIMGGLLILWAERRQHTVVAQTVDDIGWRQALQIGLFQALALIPGTSRSGATIIGSLFIGLSRHAATEFSFFLAIPTMFAATFFDMYMHHSMLDWHDVLVFGVGFVTAFVSALLAVRGLIRYIQHHDFTIFAWYRIAFGCLVLLSAWTGAINWSM